MAKIVTNHDFPEDDAYLAYNALDCMITRGVWDNLVDEQDELSSRVYNFERALQAPLVLMERRGVRVDEKAAKSGIRQLKKDMRTCETVVKKRAGRALNVRSPKQLNEFFYDDLGIKPYIDRKTGRPSTGIDALESIRDGKRKAASKSRREDAQEVAKAILNYRDAKKQCDVLSMKRSKDGRLRSGIGTGATETFRLSSRKDVYFQGGNFQNVTKRRRNIFIPDEGHTFVNVDLEQAESHCVAYLSGDPAYIAAHDEPGNTHVKICRMIWPNEDWTGDDEHDVPLAKRPNFYRHFKMYDLAKRIQHGCNYMGTKYTVARTLQIPQAEAQDIIDTYFTTFPGIKDWHYAVRDELKSSGEIISPLGYRRQFFDRVWSVDTWKEAVAHLPQSMVAFICNVGLYRVWRDLDGGSLEPGADDLQLLMQGHDALLQQVRTDELETLVPAIREAMRVRVPINGHELVVGTDAEVGPNWKDLETFNG